MNMVMNNDGSGGLWQANSLANPHTWSDALVVDAPLGSFNVVLTNPPFGTNIRIDDQEILAQYELAWIWDFNEESGEWEPRLDKNERPVLQKKQPPEILFIERCIQFLRDGGRMAIVLPNGILNNPALGYVRQWIRRNSQILAVIDMARELFQPKNRSRHQCFCSASLTAALVAAGYTVFGVNPLQASRYRERRGVSGAESDSGDAHMLADVVQTDSHQLRAVAGDSAAAEGLKVLARTHKTLIWERTRQVQRLRHQLREYFPAALEAFDDLDAPDTLELLGKAPSPPGPRG